ncbi:MAG: nitroreductase [Gammaproteobacteria bacterium]|nr:nitroreductase [Gammaproteobacteria bacterium]
MNFSDDDFERFCALVDARRSMRAFSSRPVSTADIEEAFGAAGYAPSNCNTQPWSVYVVRKEAAKNMQAALVGSIGQGKMALDYPYNEHCYAGVYKERQREAAKLYFAAAGIERGNAQQRFASLLRNLEFFGAPQAAFIFMPEWAGVREACDVGMFAQNLMLALRAKNIGSCPQTLLGYNAQVVREQLDLDESHKLLFGISFGYFDPAHSQNTVRTPRAEVKDGLTIVD